MTNEVKKVPELRFPEFDGEWEEKKLGEVVNYKNGGSFESLVKNRGVYKLITLKSVNTEGKLINSEKYIDDKCVETLCNDTLVMILSEQAPGLVGMTAIIPNNNEYVLNQRVAALVPKQFIDSQFLSKLINRNQKYFSVRSAGTKVKNISKGHVENFNFLSPDYTEQQKIGEFFSKLNHQIELEEKKLELLEQQKKGYMQKIFSQELRFKDKNGDDYPEWMETNIRNTFDNKGGTALEKEFDNNGTHKVISIGSYSMNSTYNEQNIRINKNEFTEKYLLNEGDLAMVLNDKTKEGNIIGRSIYIDEDDKYIYNQRTERLIPLTGNNHKFLWYLMNSEQFRKKIKQMMQGATQVYINYNSIKDLRIYLPILEEQNKIENFLGDIFNIIKNQSDKVELLKRRKKGFLQKMFV